MNDLDKYVEALLKKAVDAQTSEDALRYSQAALSAASIKHELIDLPH